MQIVFVTKKNKFILSVKYNLTEVFLLLLPQVRRGGSASVRKGAHHTEDWSLYASNLEGQHRAGRGNGQKSKRRGVRSVQLQSCWEFSRQFHGECSSTRGHQSHKTN